MPRIDLNVLCKWMIGIGLTSSNENINTEPHLSEIKMHFLSLDAIKPVNSNKLGSQS